MGNTWFLPCGSEDIIDEKPPYTWKPHSEKIVRLSAGVSFGRM
jgi:hypothetical protein